MSHALGFSILHLETIASYKPKEMPSKSDEPSAAVQKVRVRRGSEHTHYRSKRRTTEDDNYLHRHGEKEKSRTVSGEKSGKHLETRKPSIWRRATDATDSRRTKTPLGRKEAVTKVPERPLSSRYVYERLRRRESLPLKSEKRSALKSVTREAKDRQPSAM